MFILPSDNVFYVFEYVPYVGFLVGVHRFPRQGARPDANKIGLALGVNIKSIVHIVDLLDLTDVDVFKFTGPGVFEGYVSPPVPYEDGVLSHFFDLNRLLCCVMLRMLR